MDAAQRLPTDEAYRNLRRLVEHDPNVVGFILGGSRGKQFETGHSDYDCYVIVRDEAADAYVSKLAAFSPPLDVIVQSLTQFRDEPVPSWNRYNFAHLTAEVDRLGGEIQRIVEHKATLDSTDASAAARWALPAYTNSVYRSLKSLRDGRQFEARLDAAESINYFLIALFSVLGRLRPYNKLLRWELEKYPIAQWRTSELLSRIDRVITTADPVSQRELFRRLELLALERGFAEAFVAWRDEQLSYIRADPHDLRDGSGSRGARDEAE